VASKASSNSDFEGTAASKASSSSDFDAQWPRMRARAVISKAQWPRMRARIAHSSAQAISCDSTVFSSAQIQGFRPRVQSQAENIVFNIYKYIMS
jgi:hypothetical protein